ncbi:polysaccharide pyruvyl transferase family protein [Novosphingobium sp. CECT 9465]|uniref:polysaccharide pyruvyl transferase family protein n=1 Tax=Novosphingobium sp. CECT 9465 TaxID=2829794 RepID=UPI001E35C0AC|nr:polysaccharide pyruvyl transferase family protein [Novosphingobium sp. CECT 9465]CAH0495461.1 Exopolysaccharide glucosyl ketal-pyruvate-transferase [Novosphingobium sp. CECT 9465]
MKLAYFKDPEGNFGDDLNPWLWDQLLPGTIDDDPASFLIGVGTILEPWFVQDLPAGARKYVLGSGGGMSVPPLVTDETWSIFGVRGPLTASYLGLDLSLSTTDPAMCIRDLWQRPDRPTGKVGFMPHHRSLARWDWKSICEQAGLAYLDPKAEPSGTIDAIANCSKVLTEAMHGAIVADALRVPWFPLQISPINYVGKWHDWAASLCMPIHFKPLPDLYDPAREHDMRKLLLSDPRSALYQYRLKSGKREQARAVHVLSQYAQNFDCYLSEDAQLERAIDRFMAALERMKPHLR